MKVSEQEKALLKRRCKEESTESQGKGKWVKRKMGENTFGKKGKLCYLTSAWIWGKEEKEFIFVNPLAFLLLSVDMTYNEKKIIMKF